MTNGFKRTFVAATEPDSTYLKAIVETTNNVNRTVAHVYHDGELRDHIVDLLNNYDPIPKPEEPGYVSVFDYKGERFELRGSDRAMEAFRSIYEFYHEVVGVTKSQIKPVPKGMNEDPFTEIFRRLGELEKNLHALSVRR